MTDSILLSQMPGILLSLSAGLLIVAAGWDIASRIIPNTIPILLALAGLALRALDGTLPWAALAAAIVFAVCIACWHRGWLGGGDVKLLAAAALLVPPGGVLPQLTAVAIAGGVLALIYIIARRVVPRPAALPANHRPRSLVRRVLRVEQFRLSRGGALPYAVAIAVGGLISFT